MKTIAIFSIMLFLFQNSHAQDAPASAPKREVFEFVEEEARFPGGEEAMINYLIEHIRYPKDAQRHEVTGRVIISFIIDDQGSVTDVHEMRSFFTVPKKDENKNRDEDKRALVDEAIRVISSMPKWSAGKMNGKAVNSTMTLPIVFALK